MAKSADAFRTIGEVAEWLEVPAHVLRFWESRFTQVKPVKRAGGRRYYRPADMRLLAGIKILLHDEGMTIKGVQKILREQGVQHVSARAPDPGAAAAVVENPAQQASPPSAAREISDRPETQAEETAARNIAPEPPAPQDAPGTKAPPAADEPDAGTPATPTPKPAPAAQAPEPAVTARHPLPDLPDDPPDTIAADPGPLTRLSAMPRPLAPPLARRLAALAQDLRARIETR
jgi:DNA-binding transcriptional MerR regulator